MLDRFTRHHSCICGGTLPPDDVRAALQHDHERRLEALARLGAAAAECGVRADSDRDLVLLAEDEISLLESAGGEWARFGAAIREWRSLLPLHHLHEFGFAGHVDNPLEEPNPALRRIGGGVEAWAFASDEGSVYKFYLPHDGRHIGSVFGFRRGEEATMHAFAQHGDYRGLLEKLLLIHLLGGMATEVVAVTPEGVVVAKQTLGEPLPQGDDVSGLLPSDLIEIPSRFLRANRDHPRLFFHREKAWLIADLHARNFVRGVGGGLHVIDLVAAPWPADFTQRDTLMQQWLERVRHDPTASVLHHAPDDEL
jgi:hypothetical protein